MQSEQVHSNSGRIFAGFSQTVVPSSGMYGITGAGVVYGCGAQGCGAKVIVLGMTGTSVMLLSW